MSAEVHSEADRKRNSLGGIEGFRSSMCTLPRQVERCTVLGPEPQGETVLPLKEVIIHQSEKCNDIFCAVILKAHPALRATQDEGGCSQRPWVTEIVAQKNDSLVVGHDIGLQPYCSERKREFMMVVARFLMRVLAAYAVVG